MERVALSRTYQAVVRACSAGGLRSFSASPPASVLEHVFGDAPAVDAATIHAKLQKAQIRSTIAVAESIVELAAGPGAASATREQLQATLATSPTSVAAHVARQLFAQAGLGGEHSWELVRQGKHPSTDFRLHYHRTGSPGSVLSPWHDIPLRAEDGAYHMVVEIPRYTRAKMEIATDEEGNPIKQDIKKGKLREYGWGDMCFNYGAFAQTWEDPDHVDERTQAKGDNDPVDVIEVGTVAHPFGSVIKVKPLGVLGMIDDGETDWKVVAICVTDPMADAIKTLDDLELLQPTVLDSFREWMRLYKTVDGKPENEFAFDGEFLSAGAAADIIDETHMAWKGLRERR